jgi:hypothetical protein
VLNTTLATPSVKFTSSPAHSARAACSAGPNIAEAGKMRTVLVVSAWARTEPAGRRLGSSTTDTTTSNENTVLALFIVFLLSISGLYLYKRKSRQNPLIDAEAKPSRRAFNEQKSLRSGIQVSVIFIAGSAISPTANRAGFPASARKIFD